MKKIKFTVLFTLMIVLLIGCASTNNRSDNVSDSTDTTESQKEENMGMAVDVFSGPGEDYYYEGKYDVDAFREYKDWYEVEYLDDKRGYVKKSDIKDIDLSSLEQVVSKLIVGPTERKQVLLLNETYTLTDEIELHEGPKDSSDTTSTVPENETIIIINLEPVEKEGGLSSIDRFLYWQVEAETASGKVRGYVRSDDLFDYDNPLKEFNDVKEKNARISYNGKDYYSSDGAYIDGFLNNWHVEDSLKIKEENWSVIGGFAGLIGCNYNPEDILVSKTLDMPTVSKGKKNYHNTSVSVDTSREIPSNIITVANAALDWIPAFLNGLYSSFTIDVELQEYKGERKVVLRIDTPIEFQRDMKYLGQSFELVNLVIDAQGYTGDAWGTVDEEIRKAYPNFTGEKKYSMQITFADKEACLENPYGYYLIIDRDLNVYTELILHSGTKAVIYYDGEPVYDATQDLTSLQRLDEATAKGIIELLMKNGFSFTRTESVSGEEQHTNAAQIAGENQTNTNDIIDKYKNFIASQNELLFYSIYDIDKDGYPELFFYENHPQERESFCDIYSYSGDEFKLIERTHGPGFWHVLPTYASYPNGNGIVEYGAVKGYEFVDVHTLNDGILNTEEIYYSKEGAKYYLDSGDQAYYEGMYNNPINHQYYQSGTSSPYFEGSYLLGSNAKDNFTAIYEAFGVETGDSTSIDDTEGVSTEIAFSEVQLLNESESIDIQSSANKQTYSVQYSTFEIDEEVAGLNLSVNNITETFHLENFWVYYPRIKSVYVADIDRKDSYGNFVVVLTGEDDESETFIFAFNNTEIHQISDYQGRLVPESLNGNGIILLTYNLGMGIPDFGSLTIRPEIIVNGLSAKQVEVHCGRTSYSEGSKIFEEAVWPTVKKDLVVYEDTSLTTVSGTIAAGNIVEWEYIGYDWDEHSEVVLVKGGGINGYVSFYDLRSASFIY